MAVLYYSFLQTGSLLQSLKRYMGMRLRYKTGDTSRLLHCTMTGRGRGIHARLPLVISSPLESVLSFPHFNAPHLRVHVASTCFMLIASLKQDVSANKNMQLENCGKRHVSHTAEARLINRRSHIQPSR